MAFEELICIRKQCCPGKCSPWNCLGLVDDIRFERFEIEGYLGHINF